jgi:4-hydroxy-L-threonine phosphate dehydrogenase PdxA
MSTLSEPSKDPNMQPIVAATIGDPCGIGPEVLIKAIASGAASKRTVLVGDARVVNDTIALCEADLSVRAISSFEDARFDDRHIDVLDPRNLAAGDVTHGKLSAACGRAVAQWLDIAYELGCKKLVDAVIQAPINTDAIKLGIGRPHRAAAAKSHLFLITGPLRVVHLTDHIPLREVLDKVTTANVLDLIRLTHDNLVRWGIAQPRIGVAGLNPHCQGSEDAEQIAPAVQQAVAMGINAVGPIPPDSVFRQCIDGSYDCVVAHYHDQGHIPVKTWRFNGNCAVVLGEPFLRVSVAHGTAFDIAWKGVADPTTMIAAMRTATAFAAGRGFPN